MPESAEVKLATEYLSDALEGDIIVNWEFTKGQYEEECPSGFEEFQEALPLLVEEILCKGKLIYIICSNEFRKFYILHTMRATGKWQEDRDEFCVWFVELHNGEKLYFRNPKCLATLYFTTDVAVLQKALDSLGPDILSPEFTLNKWKDIVLSNQSKNITELLLDQTIISGCGNYTKCEVLHYAMIAPVRDVKSLKQHEIEKLYEGLRIIPRIVYNTKGTDKEYVMKVYNNPNVSKTKTPDGRMTYWDPEIQK
jgi:formamidopyrimidine-DNA glycosylase